MSRLFHKKKSEEGNVTIEATIALTAFLFMFMMIYSIITICRAQARVQIAIDGVAKEISQYTYLYSITGLKTEIDGVHQRASEVESDVNGFIGDVSATFDGIQSLKDNAENTINVGSMDELNNQFNAIKNDLSDIQTNGDKVRQSLESVAENPQALLLGLGTIMASEGFDLATSRLIAEPVSKALIKKHLKRSESDTAEQFCKSVGINKGTYLGTESYFNGLDFSRSSLFADGSDEIIIVVTYSVKLLPLLPVDAEFQITQSAVTKGWLSGDKTPANESTYEKIAEIRRKNGDSLWNYATLSERTDLIRSMGVKELKDEGYKGVSGSTYVQAYDEATNTFVMVASSNALYGVNSVSEVDKASIKEHLDLLAGQINAQTDGMSIIKVKETSSSGVKVVEKNCAREKNLVIQLVIPEDEGLKEIYEEQAKALGSNVKFEFIPGYGTAFEKEETTTPAGGSE